MKSGEKIRIDWLNNNPLPKTTEGRLSMIHELLDANVYDENGNVIGQKEPLITEEQAKRILEEI